MQSQTAMNGAAVDTVLHVEANMMMVRAGQMLQRLFFWVGIFAVVVS
jgi:hypothetical protein